MADDEKITQLNEQTAPEATDKLAIVVEPFAVPITEYIQLINFFKVIDKLIAETSPAVDDVLAMYDQTGSAADKITLANLLKVVDALTELAVAPALTDTFLVLDGGVPKKIQYSNLIIRYVQLEPFGYVTPLVCAVGDGKAFLPIPLGLDGLSLVYCHAEVETAGVGGGPMTIQVHNVTQAADMLSTKLSVDTAETGSDTAATPYVIKSNDDEIVAAYDILRLDFDVVHTAEAEGCIVTLGFG